MFIAELFLLSFYLLFLLLVIYLHFIYEMALFSPILILI